LHKNPLIQAGGGAAKVAAGQAFASAPLPAAARSEDRILIEDVTPQIDGGRYPVKCLVGETLTVQADIFRDGHDRIAAVLLYRREAAAGWLEAPLRLFDNDRWTGSFPLRENGSYRYTIEAWTDAFATWREDTEKKRGAEQPLALELEEGRALVAAAALRATGTDAALFARVLAEFAAAAGSTRADVLLSTSVGLIMARWPDRREVRRYGQELVVTVDRTLAGFAAWYEMVPRSQGRIPGRSGTFDDCIARLPELRAMGFDVVYLTPIHPIGRINRKGPDNSLTLQPGDPGSLYAIGSDEGGHDTVHPELGGLAGFRKFVSAARERGLEIALDFAVQCAPDHPWVKQHPEWFSFRPDGSLKYAENPPKKYQDIVNLDFYNPDRAGLWQALRDIVLYWIAHGVTIFRVDNPHTKPVPFWEWLIRTVQTCHPEAIFLAEAFTRPKMMRALAKAGFTQSYSYFTWRNTKAELTSYLTELSQGPMREYYRPNFFINTPDILPAFLQRGGRPAFLIRLVLAATLSPVYGIYNGFELGEAEAIPGTEEYLHSEKYEYKVWDWDRPGHLREEIGKLNWLRRANPAFTQLTNLRFLPSSSAHVLCYSKMMPEGRNVVLVAVNLDPAAPHETEVELPREAWGGRAGAPLVVTDLLTGAEHRWTGEHQRFVLNPALAPAAIFRIEP